MSRWKMFLEEPRGTNLKKIWFAIGRWFYLDYIQTFWILTTIILCLIIYKLINLYGSTYEFSVFLDLAGNTHVYVLVSNWNNHASNQRWVNLGSQLQSLIAFQEFLKKKIFILILVHALSQVSKYLLILFQSLKIEV